MENNNQQREKNSNNLSKSDKSIRNWFKTDSFRSIMASLVCIVLGLLIGFIIIIFVNAKNSPEAIKQILLGGFNAPIKSKGIAKVLTTTSPLLLCGLSILFSYKCGLFNIGAAGQYVIGAFMALVGALVLKLPWIFCILLAVLGGAIWGAIPGLFKAFLGVNEVITCIMFNWIALYLVNGITINSTKMYNPSLAECFNVTGNSLLPNLGLNEIFKYKYIGLGVFIALFAAIIIYIVLNKTKFGYEIKATGSNKNAAKYAGMNDKSNLIITMAISGGLAGLGAACYYLTGIEPWNPNVSTALPSMGFDGIAVAFLGCLNPIGTIFASLFIQHIKVGGSYLSNNYYSSYIADLISAVIIYLCAFSLIFKIVIKKIQDKKAVKECTQEKNVTGGDK